MATQIFWADLHIHSALSPCADDLLSPQRIVAAAAAAGLTVIALTDHNSILNCAAILSYTSPGLLILPGMELQTREEIHIICLFGCLEAAHDWYCYIDKLLPEQPNRPEYFGRQLIYDKAGEISATESKLLLNSADIGYCEVFPKIEQYAGLAFPAHIDRPSFSVTACLGFIPDNPPLRLAEISDHYDPDNPRRRIAGIENLKLLRSSDAHFLSEIGRGRTGLPLHDLNWDEVKNCLTGTTPFQIAKS